MKTLVALQSAISFTYRRDACMPGVSVSHIPGRGFYASIVRWNAWNSRTIVAHAYAKTSTGAVRALARAWLSQPKKGWTKGPRPWGQIKALDSLRRALDLR